jgi:hypothetical protein
MALLQFNALNSPHQPLIAPYTCTSLHNPGARLSGKIRLHFWTNDMIDYRKLDDLMDKLLSVLPESTLHMQRDIASNMRDVLENGLRKMNLVSREEFDVQSALLARLQERLRQLEQRLKDLEKPGL